MRKLKERKLAKSTTSYCNESPNRGQNTSTSSSPNPGSCGSNSSSAEARLKSLDALAVSTQTLCMSSVCSYLHSQTHTIWVGWLLSMENYEFSHITFFSGSQLLLWVNKDFLPGNQKWLVPFIWPKISINFNQTYIHTTHFNSSESERVCGGRAPALRQ